MQNIQLQLMYDMMWLTSNSMTSFTDLKLIFFLALYLDRITDGSMSAVP